MEDTIVNILNRSYSQYEYNQSLIRPLTKKPFKNRIGKKRKRKLEFEDWYEYHDGIQPVVEEYHERYKKKRKLDHVVQTRSFPEVKVLDNENFADYLDIPTNFLTSFGSNEPLELTGNNTDFEEYDLVNNFVFNSQQNETIVNSFDDNSYVIPKKSGFILGNVKNCHKHIPSEKKYHIFVLDPNWSNKSVRKIGNYKISHHQLKNDLKGIHLNSLARKSGSLILIWVTNRLHYHRFIEEELIPYWNEKWNGFEVRLVLKMIYLKLAENLEPIFSLKDEKRKPYEHLFVLHCEERKKSSSSSSSSSYGWKNVCKKLGREMRCFANIPTSIHSQKPPLFDYFNKLITDEERRGSETKCLELYSRNLLENVDSVGNEVLKFQNRKYFVQRDSVVLNQDNMKN